jgi:hypothetical protein
MSTTQSQSDSRAEGRIPAARGPSRFLPIQVIGLAVLTPALWLARYQVAAFIATMALIGLSSVWVNTAYLERARAGKPVPRWLVALERLRQYSANEGDEMPVAPR